MRGRGLPEHVGRVRVGEQGSREYGHQGGGHLPRPHCQVDEYEMPR